MTRATHPHRLAFDETIRRKRLREQVAASMAARGALRLITITTEAPDAHRVRFDYDDQPDCIFDRWEDARQFASRRAIEDSALMDFVNEHPRR